jgi:DNA-directed RNA polymerase specialized sigma24 family protein
VVAVRLEDLGAALSGLDMPSRALLDLSVRRGVPDEEIANVSRTDAAEVARRREAALDRLADELGLDGREQRDELFATLPDLPPRLWKA